MTMRTRKAILPIQCRSIGDDQVEFIASTSAVAMDGGIIPMKAWNRALYDRNSVLMWAHQEGGLPIGRVDGLRIEDDMTGTATFAGDAEAHPFAETVKRLYKNDFIRSFSVGFRLHKKRMPTKEERAAGAAWVAEDAQLIEISAVAIPADSGAMVTKRIAAAGLTEEHARTLDNWSIDRWSELAERIRNMPDDIKARQDEEPVEDEEEVEDQEPEASEDEEKGGESDFIREAAEMIATTGAALVEIGDSLRAMVGDDEEEEDDSPEEDADDEDMDDEEEEEGRTAQSLLVIRKDLKGLKEAVRALLKAGKVSAPARSKASADAGADADPFNEYADIYG